MMVVVVLFEILVLQIMKRKTNVASYDKVGISGVRCQRHLYSVYYSNRRDTHCCTQKCSDHFILSLDVQHSFYF